MSASDSEPVEQVETASPTDVAQAAHEQLLQRGRSGADWFFWIAGLSLVNTVIAHAGGDVHFVVGLGVTFIVDILAAEMSKQQPDAKLVLMIVAVAFSILCSLMACLFGWLSRKRILVLFGIGMFLYLLDGLLFLLVQDWMSVAFHAFALFSMWGGFSAYRQLTAVEQHLAMGEQPA
jgi:hypothetical protein